MIYLSINYINQSIKNLIPQILLTFMHAFAMKVVQHKKINMIELSLKILRSFDMPYINDLSCTFEHDLKTVSTI